MRSALEAVCYQTRDLMAAMAADGGTQAQRRCGSMAAWSSNDWVMQFLADILDLPVERPVVTETTALGAAYLAGLRRRALQVDGRHREALAARPAVRAAHEGRPARGALCRLAGGGGAGAMNSADPEPSIAPTHRFKWRTALRLLAAFALAPAFPLVLLGAVEWIVTVLLPSFGIDLGITSFFDDLVLSPAVGAATLLAFPATWILTVIGLLFFEKQKWRSFFGYVLVGSALGFLVGIPLLVIPLGIWFGAGSAAAVWGILWIGRDRKTEPFWA